MNEFESLFPDVDSVRLALAKIGYLSDLGLATALFCAVRMGLPLLLEGEPGVGKTEAAKALSQILDTPLIRLQCYEGINSSEAVYEWNYSRQLLSIRLAEHKGSSLVEQDLFSEEFLIERPILKVIRHQGPRPAVLLIDEVDRSDDEFEAFLLELLGEGTVTVPELGTFKGKYPPIVILTSNRTRDLHDALKRRCMYHWIDYPSTGQAVEILRIRVKSASIPLINQAANSVNKIRGINHLQKLPGIAEAINWVNALHLLEIAQIADDRVPSTLGFLLKYREDQEIVVSQWEKVIGN